MFVTAEAKQWGRVICTPKEGWSVCGILRFFAKKIPYKSGKGRGGEWVGEVVNPGN